MDVQLELLIRLQQVDIKITQLLETISALPHNLRSLEEKLQQQKVALEQADKAVPAEEARRRRLESDRKDQQQKLIKYREQSSSVKTNEQFHALQHEIGFVEAEIRRIEDEELSSMIKSESLESQRAEARKASALQRNWWMRRRSGLALPLRGTGGAGGSAEGTGKDTQRGERASACSIRPHRFLLTQNCAGAGRRAALSFLPNVITPAVLEPGARRHAVELRELWTVALLRSQPGYRASSSSSAGA